MIAANKQQGMMLPLLIVFFLPVLLYVQTVSFDFTHFDDDDIIIKNCAFLSNINNVPRAFATGAFIVKSSPFYRPLQTVSYMIDVQFSPVNHPVMFHFANMLLLGLIACVLYQLLKRLLIPQTLAILATLLYCVHPLFVSSVAWVPARGDLLLTLFSLLSFIFLIDYLQKQKPVLLFYHWLAFSVALFCKETAGILPVLFIVYHMCFSINKRFTTKHLMALLLYALSIATWLWLRSKALGNYQDQDNTLGLSAVLLSIRTIPESIAQFCVPFGIHEIPIFSALKTLTGIIIIGVIAFLFLKNRKCLHKEMLFGLSWYILILLPPMLFLIFIHIFS